MWNKFVTDLEIDPSDNFTKGVFYAGATAILIVLESCPSQQIEDIKRLIANLGREIEDEARKHLVPPLRRKSHHRPRHVQEGGEGEK